MYWKNWYVKLSIDKTMKLKHKNAISANIANFVYLRKK